MTDGKVILFGKVVSLKADQLTLDGPVGYVTADGGMPGVPEGVEEIPPQAIPVLGTEGEMEVKDIQIDLQDFYRNDLSTHFEDIKGLKWRLVSDAEDERTGTVEDRVNITGVQVKDFRASRIKRGPNLQLITTGSNIKLP